MNKQKLQEQIDTMREELAKMETELAECDKVELKDVKYYIEGTGKISLIRGFSGEESIKNGSRRATKELAEIASKNMVTRNKLEAYAHQIDPDWRDGGEGNKVYEIYLNDCEYKTNCCINTRSIGTVFMRESTAEQICEWLNDGRIEL